MGVPCLVTDNLAVELPPFAHSGSSGSLRSRGGVTCPGFLCSWTGGPWGQRCACCGPQPASRHYTGSSVSSQESTFAVSCDGQPRRSLPGGCLEAVSWGARCERASSCPRGLGGMRGERCGHWRARPSRRRVGWERSDFREDPLRAHCCWRRGSETKVAPDRILNQFNKIIQVDFKSFLQLI